jgi:hypothetical protein
MFSKKAPKKAAQKPGIEVTTVLTQRVPSMMIWGRLTEQLYNHKNLEEPL